MALESISVTAALLLGIGFGMGPCNVSCLPFLGPVFLAHGGGVRRAWRVVLPFSLGRVSGYALLGTVAGLIGGGLAAWLEQGGGRWLLAGSAVVLGVILFRRAGTRGCGSPSSPHGEGERVVHGPRTPPPPMLFAMGVGMALNPCAPLGLVLAASAASASAFGGFSLGAGFGVGAALFPALLFGIGAAYVGEEIRTHLAAWTRPLERGAGAMLILAGGLSAFGAITV